MTLDTLLANTDENKPVTVFNAGGEFLSKYDGRNSIDPELNEQIVQAVKKMPGSHIYVILE